METGRNSGKRENMTSEPDRNIWYLRVFGEMHARYRFTADELQVPDLDQISEIFKKYKWTHTYDSVDPADFPHTFWINPPAAGARGKVLKPAHMASEFLTVSREFLDVMQGFDLGRFQSWPVTLLKRDKKTPFDGEWHSIWIGNRKDGFLREQSTNFRIPPYERNKHLAIPNRDARDEDFVFDPAVTEGPDIWKDPNFSKSLLLSDRLHAALNEAGLLKTLRVLRCPLAS